MFSKYSDNSIPAELNTKELDFVADEGFNFVRIPTDYRFWTTGFDYYHPDERRLKLIDGYIKECGDRNLHVSLNLHRAPGYCINSPEIERHNMWRDEEGLNGFIFLWKLFTERYKGISSDKLSFDLVNEPCSRPPTHICTREDHERVIRKTITAIHEIDPQRQIVIDGFDGGGSALPELADVDAIHSGRGYFPFQVSHYKAGWVQGVDKMEMPEYPGKLTADQHCDINDLRNYYKPWRDVESKGVKVHIGEFGCFNKLPNDIALRWFTDLLSIYKDNKWGYSLWNFAGAFGIIEHGRPGTSYEQYKGFKVDRKLLELLKENMV
jgi:aryl-phospho-beta-D-glucosidase BglC (GH1 family)